MFNQRPQYTAYKKYRSYLDTFVLSLLVSMFTMLLCVLVCAITGVPSNSNLAKNIIFGIPLAACLLFNFSNLLFVLFNKAKRRIEYNLKLSKWNKDFKAYQLEGTRKDSENFVNVLRTRLK